MKSRMHSVMKDKNVPDFMIVGMREYLLFEIALDKYCVLSQRRALCAALGILYCAPDQIEWWM